MEQRKRKLRTKRKPKKGIFSRIPEHNRMDVLKKLDFKDFARFKQCSQETLELADDFEYSLLFKVSKIINTMDGLSIRLKSGEELSLDTVIEEPIFIEAEEFNLQAPAGEEQLEFLSSLGTFSANELFVDCYRAFTDSATVDSLIEILEVKKLRMQTHPIVKPVTLSLSRLQDLESIDLSEVELLESDFLLTEAPEICLIAALRMPISINGLIAFLKQWFESKRTITNLSLTPFPQNYSDVFEDLEYSVLWTPETYESSDFRHLGTQSGPKKLEKIYHLTRDDGKKLFVAVSRLAVHVVITAREYVEFNEIGDWIGETFPPELAPHENRTTRTTVCNFPKK